MELSWSTFLLEIINFLVLVWIIKHFLFRPVMNIVARRREEIEQTLEDAEVKRQDALKLKEQFEGRLNDWNQEKQQLREELEREVESIRAQKMNDLQQALQEARHKSEMAEKRRREDAMREAEENALAQAGQFASLLLKQGAGPETEARLIDFFITELEKMPEVTVKQLQASLAKQQKPVMIESAYALNSEQQGRLKSVFSSQLGVTDDIEFAVDESLLAGLKITVGAYVMGANLKDELQGFVTVHHD